MKGRCHICHEVTDVEFCAACNHFFCAECRGKYWHRGMAFVKELIGGAKRRGESDG